MRNRRVRDRDRDHRDKHLPSSTHLATNKYVGSNNAQSPHSGDHKGESGTSGGATNVIPTNQTKRRLSAASNASVTSDHGGSSSSRPQSPPVNNSKRGNAYNRK